MNSLKPLVEAARAAAKAHAAHKQAWEDEASDRVKKTKQKVLRDALDVLVEAVVKFDDELSKRPKTPPAPIDWHGIAKTVGGLAKIVSKARDGAPVAEVKKAAQEYIDAEWTDFVEKRR